MWVNIRGKHSDPITHSNPHPQGVTVCVSAVLMYSCVFCLCVSSDLHSDTRTHTLFCLSLCNSYVKKQSFNLADHQLPVSWFGVVAEFLWYWFCMLCKFGANMLAFTVMSDNHFSRAVNTKGTGWLLNLYFTTEEEGNSINNFLKSMVTWWLDLISLDFMLGWRYETYTKCSFKKSLETEARVYRSGILCLKTGF